MLLKYAISYIQLLSHLQHLTVYSNKKCLDVIFTETDGKQEKHLLHATTWAYTTHVHI